MLVLSRRPDEKVLLPSVPAVIKIISSQAGLVRLGIKAPARVPILREELYSTQAPVPSVSASPLECPPGTLGELRGRLNHLLLGLSLLRVQLAEVPQAARKALDGLEAQLESLLAQVTADQAGSAPDSPSVEPSLVLPAAL